MKYIHSFKNSTQTVTQAQHKYIFVCQSVENTINSLVNARSKARNPGIDYNCDYQCTVYETVFIKAATH